MNKHTLFVLFCFVVNLSLTGQSSFNLVVKSDKNESGSYLEHATNNEIIFVVQRETIINKINSSLVYIVSNNGDTTLWLNPNKPDSLCSISSIYKNNDSHYFVGNYAITESDTLVGHCDFLMKFNSNLDLIWKKTYIRPEEVSTGVWVDSRSRIVTNGDNFIIAKRLYQHYVAKTRTYIMKVNNAGDILATSLHSSYISGDMTSLSYNHDSSLLVLHKDSQYLPNCFNGGGAYFINPTTLDTCGSICYDDSECSTDFQPDGMLMQDGSTIVSGMNWCTPDNNSENYLFVRKYDSLFNEVNTVFLTDKDTLCYTWDKNLDINNNNEIFVVGTYAYGEGFFPETYNWIYLAKLDENLNLLVERYFGHDASYKVSSVLANNDGSVVISGSKYDYLENYYGENDAFILKTTPDLWVDIFEKNAFNLHSAICYPNPGIDILNIRTSIYNSYFKLYDEYGRLLKTAKIENTITSLNTYSLNTGVYFWKLIKNNSLVDKGKWIKK